MQRLVLFLTLIFTLAISAMAQKPTGNIKGALMDTAAKQPLAVATVSVMFTKDSAGKTKEAIEEYTKIFHNSKIDMVVPYEKGEGDIEGYIKHSRFTLEGQNFMAMGSSGKHDFSFNEAISFIVNCETQEEVDYYWEKLSAIPESEQCGWCKDRFGVSWQIVPTAMNKMMASGSKEQIDRVTTAFLKMKKFDIKKLEEAYQG
jgi:predicted 3-demethylubiquinone-9 3-methyltransferase (glyoxalase superfamily)